MGLKTQSAYSADNFTDNEKEMLQPAIRGTTAMMKAAKSEPSVEHVVITSSVAAIFDLSKWPSPGYTYSGKDWNPASEFTPHRMPLFSTYYHEKFSVV